MTNYLTVVKESNAIAEGMEEKQIEERESWDSKIMFLLATIG